MKKIKISLILNIITVVLVVIATVFMFADIKFMPMSRLFEGSKIEMLRYYTVDSNLLVGIVALILAVYEIKLLKNKISIIPNFVYILKLVATSGITLTFLVTAFFLAPRHGIYPLYNNSNLLFHLIIPLFAIISYIFFEKHNSSYKVAALGITPMFLYSIYYITMILIHLDNGKINPKYEFYGFLNGNLNNIYIVLPMMYLITYLISLLILFLNKKIASKKN